MAGKRVKWFWRKNAFLRFLRERIFVGKLVLSFGGKTRYVVLARKHVIGGKRVFAVFAEKRIFCENAFCGFGGKTRFCGFWGKKRFCGFGGKHSFAGKLIFIVLREN